MRPSVQLAAVTGESGCRWCGGSNLGRALRRGYALRVFRPRASLPLRIAREVLVPFGPLLLVIFFANLNLIPGGETVGVTLLFVSLGWFFCALILVPALVFRGSQPASGSSDDGDRDGTGPQQPPLPGPGGGGIPLPDAEQSRERIRDHVRPRRQWWRRRAAREPGQAPLPKIAE